MPHILAFDEGTTSARTVLYDETGKRLLMRSLPLASVYPNPGWVEQDADDIAEIDAVAPHGERRDDKQRKRDRSC